MLTSVTAQLHDSMFQNSAVGSNHWCDTLLITSAIWPGAGQIKLSITDPVERLRQTFCSVVAWCEEPGIRHIVICDGSDSGHLLRPLLDYVAEREKKLEILSFMISALELQEYGKGYGEGLIIAHSLSKSSVLRAAPSFYKVTGRLYIENFSSLQRPALAREPTFPCVVGSAKVAALGLTYRFLGSPERTWRLSRRYWRGLLPSTRTWFWHSPRRYYEDHLAEAFRAVRDREHLFLEHAFFVPLAIHGFRRFSPWPQITGWSGTLGRLHAGRDYSAKVQAVAAQTMEQVRFT